MEVLNVGASIRRIREASGMTQERLAELLGIDRSTVAYWETGGSTPRLANLPAIAEALGCQIDELLKTEKKEAETA